MAGYPKAKNIMRTKLYGDKIAQTPMDLWKATGYGEDDFVKASPAAQSAWNTYAKSQKQQAQSGMHKTENLFNNNTGFGFSNPNSSATPEAGLAENLIGTPSIFSGLKTMWSPKENSGVSYKGTDGSVVALTNDQLTAVQNPWQSTEGDVVDFTGVTPTNTVNSGGLAGLLSGIGGTKGFADLAGGLGALGSLYTGYQANKRADDEMRALNEERARMKQKDIDFAKSIAASGLGAYSAGVKV